MKKKISNKIPIISIAWVICLFGRLSKSFLRYSTCLQLLFTIPSLVNVTQYRVVSTFNSAVKNPNMERQYRLFRSDTDGLRGRSRSIRYATVLRGSFYRPTRCPLGERSRDMLEAASDEIIVCCLSRKGVPLTQTSRLSELRLGRLKNWIQCISVCSTICLNTCTKQWDF